MLEQQSHISGNLETKHKRSVFKVVHGSVLKNPL